VGARARTLENVTADEKMVKALDALRRALDKTGVPWMVIGGIAVIAHGVPRQTQDVDATLWGPAIHADHLLPLLAKAKIRPRPEHSAEVARHTQVYLMRHEPTEVDLDIGFSWLPFEREAMDRAIEVVFNGVPICIATPEDLIIYKAGAWRDRDRDDIERLLTLYASTIDTERVLGLVRQIGEALDDPQRVVILERMIREAQ
jgi:predicted nucleotidyltransferase